MDTQKVLKTLNPRKVWIPVILGIGIVVAMMWSDPNLSADKLRLIQEASPQSLLAGLFIILCRDVGYIFRIRILTGKQLSWFSSLQVIILWEFASAVTPSVVGGTAVAVFILYKEGLSLGSALAYAMLSAVLDNFFFVVAAPLAVFLSHGQVFPDVSAAAVELGTGLEYLFYISYSLIAIYTLVMAFALFSKPRALKWLLIKATSIGFLRRFRHGAINRGNEIIMASRQLKGRGFNYWLVISLATVFVWSARYFTLNAVMEAFVDLSVSQHWLVFSRQIVMWITMLISPTPGAAGTAEAIFKEFFIDFLGDYTFISMILWRALSYYPYLLLGAIVLPRWLRKVFVKREG
jgi:uncharacterized protein (TIRG00374 family)